MPCRAGAGGRLLAERAIEVLIRLCGISAIVFVFGIFFFVFREGAGFLFRGFNLREFFCSPEWYPTSQSHVRYGVLALIAGTASVTALAMAIAVPFGIGAAIFVSEFCGPRMRETLKIVIELLAAIPSVVWGFIGLTVMNPLIMRGVRRADRPERAERRRHPGADERADHRVDRRGRAEGRARLLPRGGAGARRHAVAAGLPGAAAGGEERPAGRGAARRRPRRGRDDGRADGHRATR